MSLNGTWGVIWAEGSPLVSPDYLTAARFEGRKLLPAAVPAPIHKVLMDAGLLDDPNLGLNSLKARWVEEQYWVYRHSFEAPVEARGAGVPPESAGETPAPRDGVRAWLAFDRIDTIATVWLNGELVGTHESAHRPARFEVTGKLKAGENLVVVKVSTGMHEAADKPAAEYQCAQMELLTKRHWYRKPQYQSGWDWNARLMNVGILGDVRLEWCDGPRLDQVAVYAVPSDDLSSATVHVTACLDIPRGAGVSPASAVRLRLRIAETGQETVHPVCLDPGQDACRASLLIENPRLWWPIHHGEQFRYTVEVSLECDGQVQTVTRKLGVRKIEIDQSPHPVEGQFFILKINNRPIFCKGGNWVPPDLMYSTVDEARYRELVDLALGANFNMLRIWGGGLYADHALCEACDEKGLLIWHDFGFACCKYPGDDPAFAAEVRREITWIVRELAHHASMAVWCGNNEIEWGDWAWGYDNTARTHPHYALFHHDIPKICHEEDPSKPYWISSPYSPDFKFPNDPTVGDQHPWQVSILNPGPPDWWEYRGFVDRFPNEGGVLGASPLATLRQFLPEAERHLLSPTWDHHDNPINLTTETPGALGRCYQAVKLWLGYDPLDMGMEDYAFVSGLLQAEGLSEYISNYRRRMFSSASAIFWMYNDSWPVTHGWTIVDYYRRKKLSYHPVRRAFQPVSVVVAVEGDQVCVFGINDTPETWTGEICWGIFTLDGQYPLDDFKPAELLPNASTLLVQFPLAQWDEAGVQRSGAFAVLTQNQVFHAQHRLFRARFGELDFAADPEISLRVEDGFLRLKAEKFAWGVCLDVDGARPLPDNCFDLLPGGEYKFPWSVDLGEPQIVRLGNRDAIRRP
jgi:beta-mannosidase